MPVSLRDIEKEDALCRQDVVNVAGFRPNAGAHVAANDRDLRCLPQTGDKETTEQGSDGHHLEASGT